MLEKGRGVNPALAAGLAGLAPALVYALVMRGADPNWAAALTLTVICAAAALARAEAGGSASAGLAAAAGGLAGAALLPLAGASAVLFVFTLAAAWGFRRRGAAGTGGDERLLPLVCAASIPLVRMVSLLLGSPILGLASVIAGAGLGAAIGRRVRSPGLAALPACAIVSGAAFAAAPHFLRFAGINAGDPTFLQAPLRGFGDLVALGGQSALAAAACVLPLTVAEEEMSESSLVRRLAAFALIPCSAWLTGAIGPARAAALEGAALVVYGAWRHGRGWAQRESLAPRLLAGVGALGLLAAAFCGDPLRDIWLNRLNAAYPGGHFLYLDERGPRALGAYQFSTGLIVTVEDGVVDANGYQAAALEAHLPLLAHREDELRDVLIVGALNPLTIDAAASHGARVDVLDRVKSADPLRQAFSSGRWKLPKETRLVSKPGPSYDVIVVEVPVPLHGMDAARETTREAFKNWHARLKPYGVLAVRAPRPWFVPSLARLTRGVRDEFKEIGAFQFPGALLVLASDQFIAVDNSSLLKNLTPEARLQDPELEGFIRDTDSWRPQLQGPAVDAAGPGTVDRAPDAVPLRDILTTAVPKS